MVGGISFRYSWTTGIKKKFRNLILKKGQISGLAKIDTFSDLILDLIFITNTFITAPGPPAARAGWTRK